VDCYQTEPSDEVFVSELTRTLGASFVIKFAVIDDLERKASDCTKLSSSYQGVEWPSGGSRPIGSEADTQVLLSPSKASQRRSATRRLGMTIVNRSGFNQKRKVQNLLAAKAASTSSGHP
jgi:hypothetical protein